MAKHLSKVRAHAESDNEPDTLTCVLFILILQKLVDTQMLAVPIVSGSDHAADMEGTVRYWYCLDQQALMADEARLLAHSADSFM